MVLFSQLINTQYQEQPLRFLRATHHQMNQNFTVCLGAKVATVESSVGNLSATSVTTTGNITIGGDISVAGNITSSAVNVLKDCS